jgi:BirA family biotin operon repressor/biotin-[acetyl-CoA-carboxylase] ligase
LFGVIIESFEDTVIVGIGVNVNTTPSDCGQPATSIKDALIKAGAADTADLDLTAVFHSILKALFQEYRRWLAGDFDAIRAEWLTHAAHLNQTVTRLIPGQAEPITGTFEGIADSGALLLRLADETVVEVVSAE